jgi:hypothetical protein
LSRKARIRSRGFRPRKIPKGGRFAAAALALASFAAVAQGQNPLARIPAAQNP